MLGEIVISFGKDYGICSSISSSSNRLVGVLVSLILSLDYKNVERSNT